MTLIGVEASSTVVRATGFDDRGQIVAATARSVSATSPQPGWVEIEAASVFAALGQAIRELQPKIPGPPELLSLTAPADGLWLIDHTGSPVRPAILPTDRRATSYTRDWNALGILNAVFRRAGYALLPQTQAALLRWMLDNQPATLELSQIACSFQGALLNRLTGARVADLTDASAPFLDIRSRSYDEELIDLLRLRTIRRLLPPLDTPTGSLWYLSESGAELTGLPAGLPVHVGPYDAIATGLAAGLQGTGDAFIILGRQIVTGVQIERLELNGEPAGRTVCLPRYDRWVRVHTAASGLSMLDWLLPLASVSYTDLDAVLQRTPPGSNGVSIIPAFDADGETAPHLDPNARGRISGLTTETTKDDLARAACEALAMHARYCIGTSEVVPGVVTLTGGGSRAPAFRQLLADILGVPIHIAPQPETAARGAVIAGMMAADIPYDHVAWTASSAEVLPNAASTALYGELFARYAAEQLASRPRN